MVRQIGLPVDVRVPRVSSLERHLERAPAARVAARMDPWWSAVAAEHQITELDPEVTTSPGGLVLVDVLRDHMADAIAAARLLGPDERIVFSEIDRTEGTKLSGLLRLVDTTGILWANGFSVVDVDRVPVRTSAGVWHLVTGVARPTPPVRIQG